MSVAADNTPSTYLHYAAENVRFGDVAFVRTDHYEELGRLASLSTGLFRQFSEELAAVVSQSSGQLTSPKWIGRALGYASDNPNIQHIWVAARPRSRSSAGQTAPEDFHDYAEQYKPVGVAFAVRGPSFSGRLLNSLRIGHRPQFSRLVYMAIQPAEQINGIGEALLFAHNQGLDQNELAQVSLPSDNTELYDKLVGLGYVETDLEQPSGGRSGNIILGSDSQRLVLRRQAERFPWLERAVGVPRPIESNQPVTA